MPFGVQSMRVQKWLQKRRWTKFQVTNAFRRSVYEGLLGNISGIGSSCLSPMPFGGFRPATADLQLPQGQSLTRGFASATIFPGLLLPPPEIATIRKLLSRDCRERRPGFAWHHRARGIEGFVAGIACGQGPLNPHRLALPTPRSPPLRVNPASPLFFD